MTREEGAELEEERCGVVVGRGRNGEGSRGNESN